MDKRRKVRCALMLLLALTLAFAATARSESVYYATLRYRDTGDRVTALQQALNLLGYTTGGTDGKFGPATEKAVKQFQKNNHLSVDGLAGNQTQTLLFALAEAQDGVQATQPPVQATEAPTDAVQPTAKPTTAPSDNGGLFGGNYATLRYGSRDARVSVLQQALNDLGYDAGKVDGRFGTGTQKAVTAFQRNQGLTADGLAGSRTLTALETAVQGGTPVQPTAAPTAAVTATPAPTAAPAVTAAPAPDAGYVIPARTLRKGYTGEDVRSVQSRLTTLGYYSGTIDGTYGTSTMAAVKAFQQKNSLTADGLAGARTNALLFSDNAIAAGSSATPTPPPAATDTTVYTNLSTGAKGDAVLRLQQALLALKYTVTVTGTYDADTKAAVIAFQQRNKLTADGIAGAKTQTKLYSGDCVTGDTALPTLAPGEGVIDGPSKSQIKLLHWFDDIKPTLKTGQTILVYDPVTKLAWTLRLYSLGRHADSEPLTLTDTQIMYRAFGNQNTWNQKAVYVKLPSGVWTVASTHDMPHLSGSIASNGFDGHLCVHFLRDMAEAEKNDPNYGVSNQKTIRAAWKSLTGQTYQEVVR